jgi:hypothetical protein
VLDDELAELVAIDPVDEVPVDVDEVPVVLVEVVTPPPTPLPPLLEPLPPDPIEAPTPVVPVELPVEHPTQKSDAPSTADTHKSFIVRPSKTCRG